MSVHLHTRSCYTLLKSPLRIKEIVAKAKAYGYHAVALTDKNVMHGAMAFYHECMRQQIKPILGLECDVNLHDQIIPLLLLAKNDDGYRSLMALSTYLNTKSKIIAFDDLIDYTKDCVVLTAGEHSVFEQYLINEDKVRLEEIITEFNQHFRDFYVSIAMNDSGLFSIKNAYLKEICLNNGVKTTALSRIYYADREDEESYRVLCAIDQGVSLHDKTLNVSSLRYFRTQEEMAQLYDADDLAATDAIAASCDVRMAFPKASLPVYENKFHVSSEEYLRQLCMQGLKKRFGYQTIPDTYYNRLKYELDVILKMQFADYFLIVYDFIRFARSQNIYVGPGRGSAPGSLVAYCLGITHVDPLKYHLLFERFLNPDRISMPDIDTDFPDNRRDEVIDYVRDKYSQDHVAHIVTFGTLAAKQVIRDVGKVLGIAVHDLDMLSKAIPNVPKVTLDYAYNMADQRFKKMIHASKNFEHLYAIAKKLEGLPRHASTHAAGIVLCDTAITNVCPLMETEEGIYSTQFTMEYLEELGLIKMDFLGLRNLTIIDEIVQNINAQQTEKLDIMKIPLDDEKTFACIQAADTVGIFQLESEGMKNLIRRMKPRSFEEIAATIALYRPGPMENISLYLENRAHSDQIVYDHEDLIPILKDTYGIILYQEQIMQIAQKMAGFSLAKADILRKAMSKKKLKDLQQLEKEFTQGALAKGYKEEVVHKVYALILKFANYGFNKSHSIAYGLLAYQMAYLKANAPLQFFTSLLNSVIGSESKTSEYIFEARKRRLTILPPSVNESNADYLIEQQAIRFPLLGIKNIGVAVCDSILKDRSINGRYADFYDFVARMATCKVSRKCIECLIDAGALDDFGMNRASMRASLEEAIRYAEIVKVEDQNQITINFNLVSKPAPIMIKETNERKCEAEREVLGFYLSKHPITELRSQLDIRAPLLIDYKGKMGKAEMFGQIERVRQHKTKTGDLMAFVTLMDETTTYDLVLMPRVYQKYIQYLIKGRMVLIQGDITREDSCLVKQLQEVTPPGLV